MFSYKESRYFFSSQSNVQRIGQVMVSRGRAEIKKAVLICTASALSPQL